MRSLRSQITLVGASSACALVAFTALAVAQNPAGVQCKATETQAECHARLKCKADEDLEDCKKRLGAGAQQQQGNTGQQNDAGDRDRDRDRDRDADDRDRDRDRDRDADDRGRDRDADDRGRDRRGRDDDARSRRQRNRGRGGGGQPGPGAYKKFGLGLELGEPTGLNGKYFLSEKGALDFGLGAIYSHYYYGDGIHLYGDFLWHPTTLVSASAFDLPLYIGGGLRYWSFEYCDQRICYDGSAIGIRVPVGISFDFINVPLDIFIQLVPVIDFINGDYYDRYDDRTHVGIDFSAGIRYWFK